MGPLEILDEIRLANGMNEKKIIIRQHLDNELFVKLINYAYDPNKKYGRLAVPTIMWPQNLVCNWSVFFECLDKFLLNHQIGKDYYKLNADKLTQRQKELIQLVFRKDLRIGIASQTFNTIKPNWIQVFSPMLASQFDKSKLEFPVYVQDKYDGYRCIVLVEDKPTYWSRTGKQFHNLDIFDPFFKDMKGVMFDAEIISMRGFQHLQSLPDSKHLPFDYDQLRLKIFDCMYVHQWENKYCPLDLLTRIRWLQYTEPTNNVQIACTSIANNQIELDRIINALRILQVEGAMIKNPNSLYSFKRSHHWMKYKFTKTIDLPVVGLVAGNGKYEGMIGSIVVNHNGKEVMVGSGLTDQQRYNLTINNGKVFCGFRQIDTVEIEYASVTNDGSLQHPRIKELFKDDGLE